MSFYSQNRIQTPAGNLKRQLRNVPHHSLATSRDIFIYSTCVLQTKNYENIDGYRA
jgi:hypothetical protein